MPVIDAEHARKIRHMLDSGDSPSTIVATMKFYGFSEDDVVEELAKARSETKAAPTVVGTSLMSGKANPASTASVAPRQDGADKALSTAATVSGFVLILILVIVFAGTFNTFVQTLEENSNQDKPVQYTVTAFRIDCSTAEATLNLQNNGLSALPSARFRIIETGVACSPDVTLGPQLTTQISCRGRFVRGQAYTVVSDITNSNPFKC